MSPKKLLAATAQTLVPVAGPALKRHFDNLDALRVPLATFPELAPRERIFVLAPHPDDEVLGAGGLIAWARAAGMEVQIGFLSNGDGSRTTQISQVLRGKGETTLPDIARRRQSEALKAAQTLGVDASNVLFFGFPDGGARAIWDGDYSSQSPFVSPFTGFERVEYERAFAPRSPYCRAALLENLALAFEDFAPTLVLTTHPRDTHGDHVVAYHLCEAAIASLSPRARPRLLAFLIHCGIWPVPNGYHPHLPLAPPRHLLRGGTKWMSFALSSEEIAQKKAALECHATQLGSTPRYLHAFVRLNEVFGQIT
ncbi:MAG TPA: PIG-L family deacetylase [Abditibacterium sp.]|jgi:LmbE family N-acetylglucosaminyl deacetylase